MVVTFVKLTMAQQAELEVVPPGKANDGKYVSKLLLCLYSDPEMIAQKSVTGSIENQLIGDKQRSFHRPN